MNINKILCTFTVLLLFFVCAPSFAHAQTRNIYVGDIITLEITAPNFSEEELRQKFQNFDIVEIINEADGYLISVRTFEAGEQKIPLGDKEVIINVSSTLDDIDRDGLFEGDTGVIKSGFSFHWRIVFYITAGVFGITGIIMIVKTALKRKAKKESFYRLYLRRCASLSAEDDNYFVDLTFFFKEYIASLYKRRIIGKTSGEIIRELTGIQPLNTMLAAIQEWLTECDRLKFTGVTAAADEKHKHYEKLLKIAEEINTNQSNENEGAP